MTDATKPDALKIVQGRSPAYPFVPLGEAVRRVEQIRDAGATRQAMPPETFYQIWEIGPLSSAARQTMAALNHFGLVDYVGRGDERRVKLSDLALKIVLDRQPRSLERFQAVSAAALKPPIHADLYEKYTSFLPADVVLKTFLTRDKGYNDQAAEALIGEYRATLGYAGLTTPANMPAVEPTETPETPLRIQAAVGDLVQAEINGALQLPAAKRVRAVQEHEGQTWVFVEGSETGIPMHQIIVEQKAENPDPARPKIPLSDVEIQAPLNPGLRREIITLDEGDVVIAFPANLSAQSFADLKDHLDLFIKKIQRRAVPHPVIGRETPSTIIGGLGKDEAAN
jgi:hypothetical protein